MQSVLFSSLKMLVLICVGYYLRKRAYVSDQGEDTLCSVVVNAALPAYIFANVLSVDASAVLSSALSGISYLTLGYYIVAGLLLNLYFRRGRRQLPESKRRLSIVLGMFANSGFIGIPLITELMGAQGALLATVSNLFFQLFFYTYAMYLLQATGGLKDSVKHILKLPVVWAAILSLTLFLFRVQIPAFALDIFKTLGGLCFPLSMLTIGCMLTHMPFKDVLKNREAYVITVFRLLLIPALTLLVVRLLHVQADVATAAVLLFGLPTGSIAVIYAKKSGEHAEYASSALVQSSTLMLITLPIWMWIMTMV